ncbi:YggT family protein [Sapientia aquatica]|uniref:YggT family protein n=1 Tax=Sapientia aquatica TaxID=1549640 RepID=A0A4R5VYV8_9BURK|nr:YggT family protein [Sapientia aquatica]TDK64538.1 YggT family protein [Sapientia aquatica]
MLYNLFSLVLDTVTGLFAGVLLLRFWMQIVRVRPPQPVAQFTFQLTDWLVKPMRRVIPGVGGFDWASFVGAYLIALLCTAIKVWILLTTLPSAVFLLALISVAQWIIYGWTALLILEVIFSWVNPHAPLAPFVRALNDPLLKPIRQIVPLLGGLDISPMILFLLLQVASKALMYVSGSFGSLLI